jgi:hypothetical protein
MTLSTTRSKTIHSRLTTVGGHVRLADGHPDQADQACRGEQPHGDELRLDEAPGRRAGLSGLRRDDEAETAAEVDVADGRGAGADPDREQRQAVLLTAPGLDAPADDEEQQLVGDEERHEPDEEVPAEADHGLVPRTM